MAGSRSHPAPARSAAPAAAGHHRGRAEAEATVGGRGGPRRSRMATPLRLKELSLERVAAIVAGDPRLIVPIGTCDVHGPHLPVGCDTILVSRLADDLSGEFGILRAPTLEYGASDEATHGVPREGSVRKKTLHLLLNDLLASWERGGIREFILLTANGDDAHREALATVMTMEARVRVVDAGIIRTAEPENGSADWRRGGAADTSLMLFLAPQLVDMRLAQDYTPHVPARRRIFARRARARGAQRSAPSADPTLATAGHGAALYGEIRDRIAARIFTMPSPAP